MRQVRFEITDGICRPAGCETDDIGYAAISDAQCASEARKSSTASGGRISYGIVMTVTENGFNETTSFPDISFSRKKLRDFVSMLERNDVSPRPCGGDDRRFLLRGINAPPKHPNRANHAKRQRSQNNDRPQQKKCCGRSFFIV